MRDRRSRRIQGGEHVERIHALPGLRVALGDPLERKAAGDIDQRIDPAEMRRDRVDGALDGGEGVEAEDQAAAQGIVVGRRADGAAEAVAIVKIAKAGMRIRISFED